MKWHNNKLWILLYLVSNNNQHNSPKSTNERVVESNQSVENTVSNNRYVKKSDSDSGKTVYKNKKTRF